MKKIRVAIIGQGRSGRGIHSVYLKTDARFKIMAVVDFMEERRRRAAEEYACDAYADYHDLFKRRDLDLIVNATYSHMHAPVSLEILKAGYNVLCEKPLAAKVKQVDQLIAAAKKSGNVFAIFQQSRFAPYFVQVQKVIQSGVLGRIVQISIAFNGFSRRWDWQTMQSRNGGNLANTGPHPLDQALQLFGNGIPKITCFMDHTDNSFGDAEDYVKLIMSGRGHPTIDLEISSCCAYPCFVYNVYGTRGGMKGTTASMEWKFFKLGEAPKQKLIKEPLCTPDRMPAYPQENLTWHTGSWPVADTKSKKAGYSAATAATQNLTETFYSMLYKTLTRGTPLKITPEQVRRQIAVIEECRRQNPQIYKRA
ncbi:MAG: Gfo/Idh/MocA family oxidoreductase [Verrucomicrobia bacterium]|nr:Gfo/Idh/MocA family oxidoreductase [Verrucomicrobiota bacterium]MBU1734523.1 Gfo/Idh/MocA family oxidoreductase [Verrucomicrobiota bacterium]MBU1857882.1 Gfo/Idh/MocA family oxidoreductase [Verrucomicrobiota bacterium]